MHAGALGQNPAAAMPTFPSWADLSPDLLFCIGQRLLDLKSYSSARAACTAWRRVLAPPSPSLLVVLRGDDDSRCPAAASLPLRRSFELNDSILSRGRCVGSSNGWLAFSVSLVPGQVMLCSLFNPITATEIVLPPLTDESVRAPKLVFAPSPSADDFSAATICGMNKLAYVTARARRWAIIGPVRLASGDRFEDILYHEEGMVYCLTGYGDVHVLRLPERRRRKPAIFEDLVIRSSSLEIYMRTICRKYPIRMASMRKPDGAFCPDKFRRPEEPHGLNAPATVEPLLSGRNRLLFDPATRFAPPYNKVCGFTNAKNLVFCEGNLYQIWRNVCCTMILQLPGGGHHRVEEDEVFVLRYYPQRQQPCCWDVVTDLGGYSVFVGTNNAVSMFAEGVPGLKGNCVYWIDGTGRGQGMVFDMVTGRSTPVLPAALHSKICWYFLSDMVNNCKNNEQEHSESVEALVV